MAHLELINVSKSFNPEDKNSSSVLSHVSFSLERGELAVVMGSSGSGKSTLLSLINRLTEPDEGIILFNGEDIRRVSPMLLRRKIILVQQTPFMFEGSVLDNILFGARLWKEESGVDVETLLEDFQIPGELLAGDAGNLSVGEAQRVALARAVALKPEILLLDEPTSALDEKTRNLIEQRLLRYSKKGLTMLWVSHDAGQVDRIQGRKLKLEKGRVLEL